MHVLKSNVPDSAPATEPLTIAVAELDPIDRWTVYRRLQDLGLTCRYGRASGKDHDPNRPLTVAVRTPIDALLVWSVVHTVTQAKPALAHHLERCWQHRSPA